MIGARARRSAARAAPLMQIAVGGILGVVLLHPVTMIIYWLEFRPEPLGLVEFVAGRMAASFTPAMLPMTAVFIGLGALIGGVFAAYHEVLGRRTRALRFLERELATNLRALIDAGESQRTELKSTARWDLRQNKINKSLENVIIKTIAGFLNHDGGNLIIGVADDGGIVGLDADYRTLKRKDRDGFEQFVMSLVKERLGGHVCSFVHAVFAELDGVDVCRLAVEPCDRPVYFDDRGFDRYFLRTGNATRELDVREAVEHIELRGRGARRRRSGA